MACWPNSWKLIGLSVCAGLWELLTTEYKSAVLCSSTSSRQPPIILFIPLGSGNVLIPLQVFIHVIAYGILVLRPTDHTNSHDSPSPARRHAGQNILPLIDRIKWHLKPDGS
jgi:hypothetical protein